MSFVCVPAYPYPQAYGAAPSGRGSFLLRSAFRQATLRIHVETGPNQSVRPQIAFASASAAGSTHRGAATFYPKGLKQADELAYAASHLTSIEINATHYRLQSRTSFRKWAAAAPDGFVFSVKGPRLVTQQKVLAETGNFI